MPRPVRPAGDGQRPAGSRATLGGSPQVGAKGLKRKGFCAVRGFGLSILGFVVTLINLYQLVILVRALISWVSPDPRNPIVQFLIKITEPVLKPLRKLTPPQKLGGIDLSPILAIVILEIAKYALFFGLGLQPRFLFF
jgi:YggT family protein